MWLLGWIPKRGVLGSKPGSGSKVDSGSHPSEFNHLFPRYDSVALRQVNPIHKMGSLSFFLKQVLIIQCCFLQTEKLAL